MIPIRERSGTVASMANGVGRIRETLFGKMDKKVKQKTTTTKKRIHIVFMYYLVIWHVVYTLDVCRIVFQFDSHIAYRNFDI